MLKIELIGKLGRDPELNYRPNGDAVANFSVAHDNGKDDDGNPRQPTWVDVSAWGNRAEFVNKYFDKGDGIYVEGSPKAESWLGDDGRRREQIKVTAMRVEFAGKARPVEDSE